MLLMWRSKRSCKQRQRHQFLFLVSCGEWQNTPSTETPDTAPLHSLFCFFYLLLGRKGHLPHKRFTLSHSTFCNLLQRWKGKGKKCPHRTFLYHTDILFIYANGLCGIRWDLCVPFLSWLSWRFWPFSAATMTMPSPFSSFSASLPLFKSDASLHLLDHSVLQCDN